MLKKVFITNSANCHFEDKIPAGGWLMWILFPLLSDFLRDSIAPKNVFFWKRFTLNFFLLQCIPSFMIFPHMYIRCDKTKKRAVYKQKVCCFAFFSFIAIKASCIPSTHICFHRQKSFFISPKDVQKFYLIKHANIHHEKSFNRITRNPCQLRIQFALLSFAACSTEAAVDLPKDSFCHSSKSVTLWHPKMFGHPEMSLPLLFRHRGPLLFTFKVNTIIVRKSSTWMFTLNVFGFS